MEVQRAAQSLHSRWHVQVDSHGNVESATAFDHGEFDCAAGRRHGASTYLSGWKPSWRELCRW